MMEWIIPRIGRFHDLHPGVELQFNMNYDRIDFMRDKIGIAIRSSVIKPPQDAVIRDLGREEIGLVCAPSYLRQSPLENFHEIARANVLATQTRPEAFSDWREAVCADFMQPEAKSIFPHFYLLIQGRAVRAWRSRSAAYAGYQTYSIGASGCAFRVSSGATSDAALDCTS